LRWSVVVRVVGIHPVFGRLREQYERTMRPVGRLLARTGLPPHAFTILSVLVAVVSAYAYGHSRAVEGSIFLLLSAVVDMFDGGVARATGRVTRFGAVFDHVLDRYAECIVVAGIVYGGYTDWSVGIFALFGMLMASFTRAKAESVGGIRSCTVGVAERQEKLLILIAGSLASSYYPASLAIAVVLVGTLSHVTVVQRLQYTWVQTRGN
jgi:CDP-diacylglycerol--glycerol-3-phosphate 3-phosphatidyltransferase/archaetidylinositol phosphate synthase